MGKKGKKNARVVHAESGSWFWQSDARVWVLGGQPFQVFEGDTPTTAGRFFLRRVNAGIMEIFGGPREPKITPLEARELLAALDEADGHIAAFWIEERNRAQQAAT